MNKFINILGAFFILLCLLTIKGCGQTGDLYIPEDKYSSKTKNEYRV